MAAEEEVIILARLAGTRQFLAQAAELGVAVEELGIKTDLAGAAFGRTTKRSYLMNQALFTVRRLMYGVTLATLATGIAAVRWGWQFNSAMQQARVALSPVFATTQSLNRELDYLFNFTKYTPFQFKDITIAFRQMYGAFHPLGISIGETNATIKAMVDALAFVGRTSPGALNRVAVALQHMAFQGRLTGQTTLQLARDGLPIYAALRKELGLTADQMHHVGQLGIPTSVVLKALIRYIQTTPGYANAAYRQATGSLHGLFTTFKDNLSQLMGAVETGFFGRMQNNLVRMNAWFSRFSGTVRGGNVNDIVRAIDPRAVFLWKQFAGAVSDAWKIFKTIISVIFQSRPVWATIIVALTSLHLVLAAVAHTTMIWRWPLSVVIGYIILFKTAVYAARIATAAWMFTMKVGWVLIRAFYVAETLATGAVWLYNAALAIQEGEYLSLNATMIAFNILAAITAGRYYAMAAATAVWEAITGLAAIGMAGLTLAVEALTFALMVNPIALLAEATILLITGLAILYFRWRRFHDAVNATIGFIWRHPMVQMLIPIIGPLITIAHLFTVIYNNLSRLYNLVRHPIKGLEGAVKGRSWWKTAIGMLSPIPIPGLAGGGGVLSSGLTWVGEHGPELLSLPRGATVAPLSRPGALTSFGGGSGMVQPLVIQVMLPSKRVLAEAYAEVHLDAAARA